MKKYIYLIIIAVSFIACEKELELDAPSQLTSAGFWESEEGDLRRSGEPGEADVLPFVPSG